MRLRRPCRRLDKLDAAFELRNGKEPATSCIMMQPMTIPLAVRLVNLGFSGRLLGHGHFYENPEVTWQDCRQHMINLGGPKNEGSLCPNALENLLKI